MKVTWLCWYVSGVLTLLCALSLLVSYAPGAEWIGKIEVLGTLIGALIAACFAVALGRLPSHHWVNSSKPVWASVAAVALAVTVLAILVG